ncbi:acyltransferase [Chlamydia pecorum MC/MarsBar]|nr:acyltransferase [Chlamydia pecorum MC/MarsBar]ETF37293.1 acyltransferase [Chlamydia pecorum DBDeUG]ETF37701.1 acyltransferase [Chlamydia pecorum VR629]ETF39515.1 acyltransferase [Chlamydia pecorum IPTaLE]KZN27153.1 bacterial lipid A biosynthesis acyltransferase family protein [Chlamydia pecorum]
MVYRLEVNRFIMWHVFRKVTQYLLEAPVYYSALGLMALLKCLPNRLLFPLSRLAGSIAFYCIPDYRKTALTNLALAFPRKTFQERRSLAKQSLQHLMLTGLELLTMEKIVKKIEKIITIAQDPKNPPEGFLPEEVLSPEEIKETFQQLDQQQGVILFCGHQANWELPFLYITKDYPGLALAKSIKNQKLNKKIFSLREIYKGKIVGPKQGIHHAIKTLKQGHLVGIVGDQALLMSSYSYPLFGECAFTTTSPALLAYKTGAPVLAISVYRRSQDYLVIPSKKFYADKSLPMKEATSQLMDKLMGFLEKGIACKPEQWLWVHKRWKRKLSPQLKKKYRYSHILVIVSGTLLYKYHSFLSSLGQKFSGASLTLAVFTPNIHKICIDSSLSCYKILPLKSYHDLLEVPNSFVAVFDLKNCPKSMHKHFKKTGSLHTYTENSLKEQLPNQEDSLEVSLERFFKKSHAN